jgi:hypothetical protein
MTEWEIIGFDPDNFDIERYPMLNENMTREHFYQRYLSFRALAREINLVGQLRHADWRQRELQSQIDALKGSRLIQGAMGVRSGLRALREKLASLGRPAEITTKAPAKANPAVAGRARIGITPKDLEAEKAAQRAQRRGLPGFKSALNAARSMPLLETSTVAAAESLDEANLPHPG